ncbi:MAG: 3-deoxy-8-phosphooctulonate synthase [Candidatus Fermentibacteraceae bacterium]|nr:3-deoxy-8-phosphooctulonate synthase [Candidatus Fermentibacteraceae bacterium]MBN2608001.1 3-deoxy-8-phosphooctulonate synthase [Candidatus Fermentibacteraceae bacterium]
MIGPCSLESMDVAMKVAEFTSRLMERLDGPVEWVFKGSFLKDNRTSPGSYRGPGMDEGLRILEKVSSDFGVRTLTDIHSSLQAGPVGQVADVIQVPAFLCRQTSILEAAGATGKPVNIKKGQFMAPMNMKGASEKVTSAGCPEVWLTERGTFFGYGDLVVDLRSLSVMKEFAARVILDVTHSLQLPGAAGDSSGGCREYAQALARAGAAWGVDGLFIEAHPCPSEALSDSATMVDLPALERMVRDSLAHWEGR